MKITIKTMCKNCGGNGFILQPVPVMRVYTFPITGMLTNVGELVKVPCDICKGTGYIEVEGEISEEYLKEFCKKLKGG